MSVASAPLEARGVRLHSSYIKKTAFSVDEELKNTHTDTHTDTIKEELIKMLNQL